MKLTQLCGFHFSFLFKEEVFRALSKGKVPVKDFIAVVDNWKKVIPNLICTLGDNDHLDDDSCINFSEYKKSQVLTHSHLSSWKKVPYLTT